MSFTSTIFGSKNYPYGSGRVGVLQQYLLSQSDVERLLATETSDALLRTLQELKISSGIQWTSSLTDYLFALERWLEDETFDLVDNEKDREVFSILWLRSDASVLAYLLKKHYGFTAAHSQLPKTGVTAFSVKALTDLVEGRITVLPSEMTTLVKDLEMMLVRTPQMIDEAVAKCIAALQTRYAKKSGSLAICQYTAHHIDLLNIRTASRLSNTQNIKEHLIDGGEIPVKDFSMDPAKIASLVRASTLPASLLNELAETDDIAVTIERALAKALAKDIAHMRAHTLTIEPLFAFVAIAQSQIRVLRSIIIGKSTNLSLEQIRSILPPFLSASPLAS